MLPCLFQKPPDSIADGGSYMGTRKTIFGAMLALLVAGVMVAPAGATPLAPNASLDIQGQGLTIAEGGVGLEGLGAGTRTISVNVGGPVQKAFLYWAGRRLSGCHQGACFEPPNAQPFGDQELIFDGTAITGTIIGIEDDDNSNIGYRHDVTDIVTSKGTGALSFSVSDGNTALNLDRLAGAGLLVFYTNPADPVTYRAIVFEGLDFAFGVSAPGSGTPFPENLVTDPVTFSYAPTTKNRNAELLIFAGDGEPTRPDRIDISDNPSQFDQLNGTDGHQWDTDLFPITVPAGVGSTTTQLFSAPSDQNPNSLLWVLGALRIPIPDQGPSRGCTPGYWKNHVSSWGPSGFAPGSTLGNVFTVPAALSSFSSSTLHQALSFGGGSGVQGGAKILFRAAVASLLNAAHPAVNFPQSANQVITSVNVALASNNRDTMLSLASQLDAQNNLGCPLN